MNIKDTSYKFVIGFIIIITFQSLTLEITKLFPDLNIFQQSIAQISTNNQLIDKNTENHNISEYLISASGHFASNQIKNGIVTWIQGGYWNLKIHNTTNSNHSNQTNNNGLKANFTANFTMIKPDGSLSHNHVIKNFSSNQVILTDRDIIITGVSDILPDNSNGSNIVVYKQVPLLIHLMGKRVLGLTIDANKTQGHFASSNEMFGTLISGIGLDISNPTKTTINKKESMIMLHH
ncbi:MAG: hypothetical protein M3Z01_08510 [Thermoproteota archaeon]|nr:hypothetical protein [Thermoproteota archaeon]